ncbi:hypothetical protein SLEP1_g44692 [Rubroshorea leprosula]|uniref:non-specific serine/threonine protein kinase n=1 Tax=Rubroshorea leprosula TaxID=152421 RepID=A0AAV5LI56_9ROSI|nr:hypothetical protein SLEP1_g44692 [Rubroshorea leprosula]
MDNVRSFPEGDKNCYNLNLTKGDRYLIRASFMYGNYDEKNETPQFDLYLGPNLWCTVSLQDASASSSFEIIHTLQSNHLYVCLVNTGEGTPFISALVLRPLKNTTYESQTGSLDCFGRYDVGSTAEDGFRFKEDVYDRYWVPLERDDWTQKTTKFSIDSGNDNDYQPPSLAMRTAAAPVNANRSLDFPLGSMDSNSKLYVYMHFAEVEELEFERPRQLIVSYNDFQSEPFSLEYLKATTKFFLFELNSGQEGRISIYSTEDSTLPPILNAIEICMEKQFSKLQTAEQDVDAILNIKLIYGLKRNWQGDPCAPPAYLWEGLNCSDNDPPRIISLNLSSSGLTGEIPPYIANFIELQYLDLSNNRLTGSVPEFLSHLQFLKVLNLKANMLKGSVPAKLIEMSENGLQLRHLEFGYISVEGNPDLCASMSCKKKSIKNVVAVVILSSLWVLMIGLGIIWRLKRRKVTASGVREYHSLVLKNLHVTYSEVLKITNNFERILGKGGFGTVFHGYLGDTQVAVKMLSHSPDQGYKQFEAEVALLLRVHHRNLTSLIGYCAEGNKMGLIYEYMAKGNLAELLSESSIVILSWEQRFQIVADAASGVCCGQKRKGGFERKNLLAAIWVWSEFVVVDFPQISLTQALKDHERL